MRVVVKIGVAGMVAAGPLMSAANAQDNFYSRDKYEAVTDRNQPEFDPEPIRLGAMILRSSAEAGLTYNSNVFASGANEESDTVARIGARANLTTDWSNHEVGARVSAVSYNYLDNGDESNEDLLAEFRGRLDVTQAFDIGGAVFAQQRSEQRTDFANAVGLDRPVEQSRTGARIEANYRNDRFRWESALETADTDFEDARIADTGAVFDQDFRDRTTTTARTRLSYAVTPNVAVFGQGAIENREFDNLQTFTEIVNGVPTQVTRTRDSDNVTLAAGVDFELQSLIRGDVAIGQFEEDRADPTREDRSGLSVDARVQWFPSRLTTVTGTVGRQVVDLGLIDSATATQERYSARLDHELRRNIVVSAFAALSNDEYDDVDRSDDVSEIGVSGLYKLNKNVHAELFARRLDRDVSGSGIVGDPSYSVDLIGIGFRFYP